MKTNFKLTTRGRYAVMAMVQLAGNGTEKPMPLSNIAKNGNISLSYLEQLISGLRRHSLVKSYRGPGGGYALGKPANNIFISDILIAAEDSTPAKRNAAEKCDTKTAHCDQTQALWGRVGNILHTTLEKISLEDVIENRL